MKTKDRILQTSIELFNRSGVVPVTTNHIAKALNISPGNLYFHFKNKEEIIRHIFKMMCKETYRLWRTKKADGPTHPLDLIQTNFEIFWKYRFFHREMYYLRRKDSQLGREWRAHLQKIRRLITLSYQRWLTLGWMKPISSEQETNFIVNVLLVTASSFLQFFESTDRQVHQKHIVMGQVYIAKLLVHWTQGSMRKDFDLLISRFETSVNAKPKVEDSPTLSDAVH